LAKLAKNLLTDLRYIKRWLKHEILNQCFKKAAWQSFYCFNDLKRSSTAFKVMEYYPVESVQLEQTTCENNIIFVRPVKTLSSGTFIVW
jgi:heme oxygenase